MFVAELGSRRRGIEEEEKREGGVNDSKRYNQAGVQKLKENARYSNTCHSTH